MTPRQTQRITRCCTAFEWLFLLGAACFVVRTVAFQKPLRAPRPMIASSDEGSDREVFTAPSLDDFASIWKRDLRQTLIEPKPKAKPKPPAPRTAPPVRLPKLLATFIENGRSWGIFVDAQGVQRVRGASGKIDDFQILRIVPGGVHLRRAGKLHEITVPKTQNATRRPSRRRPGH